MSAEKERGNGANSRECAVTLKKGKLLLSAAAGAHMDSQAEIYECGMLLALVNDAHGQLHLIQNSRRSARKDISVQTLCAYLMDKFNIAEGEKLPAWYDERTGALLLGTHGSREEPERGFHVGFKPLSLPLEQFETASVFMDHSVLMLSRAVAKRFDGPLMLYERGDCLCLVPDVDGLLEATEYRHSAKGVASKELVAYIRKKFGPEAATLPTRICNGKFYFSNTLPAKDQDFSDYRPVFTQMSKQGTWVTLMKSGVVRLSAKAGENFRRWVSVYEYGDVTAFVPDEAGKHFRVSHGAQERNISISSVELQKFLMGKYGCVAGTRFYAKAEGGTVFFSNRCLDEEYISLARFVKSSVNDHRHLSVRLFAQHVYIGKAVAVSLYERFSAYYHNGMVALVDDVRGEYRKGRDGTTICSAALAQELRKLFPGNRKLYAAPFSCGILLGAMPPDQQTAAWPRQITCEMERYIREASAVRPKPMTKPMYGTYSAVKAISLER